MIERKTILSPCTNYRYILWRDWSCSDVFEGCNDGKRRRDAFVQFIGLNPSTADETLDDPTIRRCVDFAKRWGYGALCMTNLFAWRTFSPKEMKKAIQPVGETVNCNVRHILNVAHEADRVVCCWGCDGRFLDRQEKILQGCRLAGVPLHHLGLNGDGTPKHPLYVKATTQPILWT